MCVIHFKSFQASGPDMHCLATSATFNVDAGQVEIEILTLQNDLHLKAHQDAPNFWCLVDTEKYKVVSTAAMKVASLFGSTYLIIEQTQNTPY